MGSPGLCGVVGSFWGAAAGLMLLQRAAWALGDCRRPHGVTQDRKWPQQDAKSCNKPGRAGRRHEGSKPQELPGSKKAREGSQCALGVERDLFQCIYHF
jgi:hypothetical protein